MLLSLYFIYITVLVSEFLFSLEGEEEDHDLVIAKGLGPTYNRICTALRIKPASTASVSFIRSCYMRTKHFLL